MGVKPLNPSPSPIFNPSDLIGVQKPKQTPRSPDLLPVPTPNAAAPAAPADRAEVNGYHQGFDPVAPQLSANTPVESSDNAPVDPRVSFGDTPASRTGDPDAFIQTSRSRVSPERAAAYDQAFAQLSPAEQTASREIAGLLSETPPPADLRSQLRDQIATLPEDAQGRRGMDVGRTLNHLGIYLPSTADEAPGSEDASARLDRVYMDGYTPGSTQAGYVNDMIRVADREGFRVTVGVEDMSEASLNAIKTQMVEQLPEIDSIAELDERVTFVETERGGYEWGEDNKWLQQDGTLVTISDVDDTDQFRRFVGTDTGADANEVGGQGYHTAGLARNSEPGAVSHTQQGGVAQRNTQIDAEQLAEASGLSLERTRSYLEGGNMLSGTLPNGDPYALVGKDSLLLSTFDYERQKIPEFSADNVTARRESMGLNADFDSLPVETQALVEDTAQRLFESARDMDATAPDREAALDFLAKQDIAKDILAQDIGVPREDITIVDQPEFHIDMYMRPLAPGQVMINDFDANKRLLEDALSRAEPDSEDALHIHSMLENNEIARAAMEPVNQRIIAQLESAGIEVIRAPGVFKSENSPDTPSDKQVNGGRLANFMNAVPATRPGTNEQIFLTNHSSVDPLREAYVDYMQGLGISQVYFLGTEKGSGSRSVAEMSLKSEGGLDCRENH